MSQKNYKKITEVEGDNYGIRLVYRVSSISDNHLKPGDIEENVEFLKPTKSAWSRGKNDCPKKEYGSKSSPYTNVWVQIDDKPLVIDGIPTFTRFHQITDSELIKNLNRRVKNFSIGSNEPITKISLKNKIAYHFSGLINPVKSLINSYKNSTSHERTKLQ